MKFQQYPFQKLNLLLEDIKPNPNYKIESLTIGEPQFETPMFIQTEISNSLHFLNKYPKSLGEDFLRNSQINFVNKRFSISLEKNQILPTFGTREVLFNFPQFLLHNIQNPTMAFTNPFYQIYDGAAIACHADKIYINLTKENNFTSRLSDDELKKCNLVILNYPNNPTGSVATLEELSWWVKKALEFDFVLLNDECYSEIYNIDKPYSLLEASKNVGNDSFKNILVINSISKRSSAPSLRSGFIAGDKDILSEYAIYRTYIGCASPLPLQYGAAVAWNDDKHVEEFRENYRENFKIAEEILGITPTSATFYIWLEVGDDLKFVQELYKQKTLKTLPGRFLGRDSIGEGYIRLALVETPIKTREILQRLKDFIDENKV